VCVCVCVCLCVCVHACMCVVNYIYKYNEHILFLSLLPSKLNSSDRAVDGTVSNGQ
jgi:hypothetical protein